MLSASLMAPGPASAYPPPLLPARATLANYRELFTHADGAREFRLFRSIIVPGLRPIIVTLAVFTMLGTWNDFMWPLIVLSDQDLYTLPVALASLSREHVQDNELMMAGAVVTTLPVLLLFLVLQRQYIRGLMAGSVKG